MSRKKEIVAADPRQELIDLYAQVDESTKAVHAAVRNTVELYFEAGRRLEELWGKSPAGVKLKDFYKVLDLPERHATNSLRIYKHFCDNPDAIKGLSVGEALQAIAACHKKQKELAEPRHYNLGSADEQPEFHWEDTFQKAPLAKVVLNNYRLEVFEDKELWLVRRGEDIPVKVVDVFLPEADNPALKLSRENMIKDIQKSIEKYYSHVEKQEEENGRE